MKSMHRMPFGAELGENGVRFSIWAPAARYVTLHVGAQALPMQSREEGFFERLVHDAGAGARYGFSCDGTDLVVPDPASRFNPDDVHARSEVVDPLDFDWQDADWRGRPWREAVVYELHAGTFTAAGTLAAAADKLDYLADLGVTAVELMPLADTPGVRNWGYDGVLPFALEHAYGRPEDLKRFVQAAHERGLMVLLDVVYNHFGPEGNYLHGYAPQFFTERHHTPWGAAINFDDDYSDVVRRYFIHNAIYWLEEYHFDGLRLDAVHAIIDDSEPDFLSDLAAAVKRADLPRLTHLVLENDRNSARRLRRGADGEPVAYAAQWNDDFHHTLHVLMTGERGGHYQDYDRPAEQLLKSLLEGFVFQGEISRYRGGKARGEPSAELPPEAFVNFLQNHDQVGNRHDGKRLWMLAGQARVRAAETLLLLLPTTVLLFMGDEFHAESTFPFFCDFHGELAEAVNEGRRRELGKLGGELAGLPPPTDRRARDAAVLDWRSLDDTAHADVHAYYRVLLGLRRDVLFPRLPARAPAGTMTGEAAFTARWRLADGSRLRVSANLSDEPVRGSIAGGELLVSTEPLADAAGELPPWLVAWILER